MSIAKSREIKSLTTQLKKAQGDAAALKLEVATKQKEYSAKLNIINKIKEKIKTLNKGSTTALKITEHAIVRYFERVKGYDLDEIEKEILSPDIGKQIQQLGGTGTVIHDKFKIIVKDNTVITIK